VGRLTVRIGGDGPVVVESSATCWRLIVHGQTHATGLGPDDMHTALRELALSDRALALDAFGVVMNCVGAWEDEYTEEHGEEALDFDNWLERIEYGGTTVVGDDGELYTSV
jgi:hypothetical protein